MNWMNIKTESLRSAEFSGCDNAALGVWLRVLSFCCEQENGGRLAGAVEWNDRTWMISAGVTKAEVESAKPLLYCDGADYFCAAYPTEKEAMVAANRKAGKRGGKASAQAYAQAHARPDAQAPARALAQAPARPLAQAPAATEGEGEGERKENKKGTEEEPPAPAAHKKAGYAIPECFAGVDGFADALQGWIDSRKQLRKPATDHAVQLMLGKLSQQPGRAIAALNKCILSGWQGFEWTWMDGDRNNGASLSPFDTQGGKRLMQ